MTTLIHSASSRGLTRTAWLESYHSFNFGSFFHDDRKGFGALRVINEDFIDGGAGFATHPHRNMEILSIPLSGGLHHKDSAGHEQRINAGEVQLMSAGQGIEHSEFNLSATERAHFLQIWITPDREDTPPSYQQMSMPLSAEWQLLVSPHGEDSLQIKQNAYVWRYRSDRDTTSIFKPKVSGAMDRGIYLHVVAGAMSYRDQDLDAGDGLGLLSSSDLRLTLKEGTDVLVFEVPTAL